VVARKDGSNQVDPEDEPGIGDPAERTRLAWTRTAIAFAAIGAAMLKSSPVGGAIVVALSVPVWAATRRAQRTADALATDAGLRLVALAVVLVGLAAIGVALIAPAPASLSDLIGHHGP
jgi:uncharacterized membrane protein YidH (DUF202 family)